MFGTPAAARALVESTRVSHCKYAETIRHSLRGGFTAYTCSPRCTGLFSHRRLEVITQDLIPASGDQDHTISPSAPAALVSRSPCVHRIPPPTFVTIGRSAPPERAGCGKTKHIFLKNGSEIFEANGLTLCKRLSPLAKLIFTRTRLRPLCRPGSSKCIGQAYGSNAVKASGLAPAAA